MLPNPSIHQLLTDTYGMKWVQIKQPMFEFLYPFGVSHCEFSGEPRRLDQMDAHHWLLNDQKAIKHITTTPLNMAFIDHDLHIARVADNMEFRRSFLEKRIDLFGKELYAEWFSTWPELWAETRTEIWLMMEDYLK